MDNLADPGFFYHFGYCTRCNQWHHTRYKCGTVYSYPNITITTTATSTPKGQQPMQEVTMDITLDALRLELKQLQTRMQESSENQKQLLETLSTEQADCEHTRRMVFQIERANNALEALEALR